jgi:two-component system probable response regulator PhcQ
MSRILILDDEESILSSLHRLMKRAPCTYGKLSFKLEVETESSPEAALARVRDNDYDLVISDYQMPGMNGTDFLAKVREIRPDVELILMSGIADLDEIMRAYQGARIYRFIGKPWNDFLFMASVAEALNHGELVMENKRLAAGVPDSRTPG